MKIDTSKFVSFLDERYIPLDPKFKILIGAAIIALPIVAFYFLYFKPNTVKISGLESQIVTLTQETNKLRTQARDLPKVEQQVKELELTYEKTTMKLPTEQEIPQLLRDISTLGRESGLDIMSFTPGQEIKRNYYNEIPIDIIVRGPYHSIGYFFQQVAEMDRVVVVTGNKTSAPQSENGEILLTANVDLVTYRFTNQVVQQ